MSLLDVATPINRPDTPTQFHTLTVVSLIPLVFAIAWAFVDARTIDGVHVWVKPLKFAVSLTLFFATIAVVERYLSETARSSKIMLATGSAVSLAYLFELGYLIYMAAQAEKSHFNDSTPWHEAMYVLMGAGAVTLVAGVGVVGWVAKRDSGASLGAGLREGIWLGFLFAFLLTLLVAGYLGSNEGAYVGLHPEGAPTVPLMGWSGVTGDLRPAHFMSIHAMQALPLLGWWLDRRDDSGAVIKVRLATLAYTALTLGLFAQALLGQPLIPMQ